MTQKYKLIVIVLLVTISGCPEGDSGGNIDINGNMTATEQGFRLDGKVVNSGLVEPMHTNITVYLYTANGSVIESERIGSLNGSGDRLNVTMQNERIPEYVILNSPTFWQYNNIDLTYYELDEDWPGESIGAYVPRTIGSKDEFPVEVPY